MKNNFIFRVMAKFAEFLCRQIFFLSSFFLPIQNNYPISRPTTKCKTAVVVVVHLPLETFAEILQFASVDDLNQRMVHVSHAFAALSLPLLRCRFAERSSAWVEKFKNPIEDQKTFQANLKKVHISLEDADIHNSKKPRLNGTIRVLPVERKKSQCKGKEAPVAARKQKSNSVPKVKADFNYLEIYKQSVTVEWRANGAENWNIYQCAKVHEEGTNRYIFRIEDIPVDNAEGAILEFRLHYKCGPKGQICKEEKFNEIYCFGDWNYYQNYQFEAKRGNGNDRLTNWMKEHWARIFRTNE